ncbi:hypothetical protein BJV74DRAFT_881305 [Russula compacta]|nr:hypothetical protein BJV74DRAFT_881305 [Russula compacta]
MSISDDDFDKFPDPFAGIDWNTVPELSTPLLPSPSNHPTSSCAPTPVESRPSTLLASGEDSTPTPSQYSYDDIDAAFLAEVDKVERRLLQSQELGLEDTCDDRGEGPSTHSNTGSELTSRYFHEWHAEEDLPSLQSRQNVHPTFNYLPLSFSNSRP